LRRGDAGIRVRELQVRLSAVIHSPTTDADTVYGDGTVAMVEAFQRTRGLPITGVVDVTTWSSLVEAGWRIGQRLLYLATPNLRGDDVAELQIRLAQLGFNPGRIDGIFGTVLESALTDFQRNCGLEASGALTRATYIDLLRLSAMATDRHLVTEARDQAGFNDLGTGPLIVCGGGPLVPLVATALGRAFEVHVLVDAPTDEVAQLANDQGAALVLSFDSLEQLDGIHLHYWASYHSHSRRGDRLAGSIAAVLAQSNTLPRVEVTGMALPILRETKMTTLHIEYGNPSDQVLYRIAAGMSDVVMQVFHRDA